MNAGVVLEVSDGRHASETIVNSDGCVNVSEGGMSDGTILNSGGTLCVQENGTATVLHSPWQSGTVVSMAGAIVNYISNGTGVYYGNETDGVISHAASMHGADVVSGNSLLVYIDGIADGASVGEAGTMQVYQGGVANATTVESGGTMQIYSGGSVDH